MKKYQLLLMAILNYPFFSFCQSLAVDSKGKDVFNFYTTKTFTLPVSSANSSIKVGYNIPLGFFNGKNKTGKQFYVKNFDNSNFTVATSSSLNITTSVSDLGKNLASISTFHPSYGVSIGYSNNIDIFNNWGNIGTLRNNLANMLFVWSITANLNTSNLLIYDTLIKSPERKKPLTKGVTLEFSYFFKKHRWIALSFSGTYENGWNISDLKNYQENKPTYSNSDIISLGDYVGKIGDLKNVNNARFRFSLPILIDGFKTANGVNSNKFFNKLTHLAIIPYYSAYGVKDTKFNTVVGAFVNLLEEKYGYTNSKIVPGGGIGIDWIKSSKGWSTPNVFVSGTLSIDTFFKHDKAKDTQQTQP